MSGIHDYKVVEPATVGGFFLRLNEAYQSGSILEFVVTENLDELAQRRLRNTSANKAFRVIVRAILPTPIGVKIEATTVPEDIHLTITVNRFEGLVHFSVYEA